MYNNENDDIKGGDKKSLLVNQRKSVVNKWIQGISGVFGFPYTLAADVGVIGTHYIPMFNDIRDIYGRPSLAVMTRCWVTYQYLAYFLSCCPAGAMK